MAKIKVSDNFPKVLTMALEGDISQGDAYLSNRSGEVESCKDGQYIGIYQLVELRKVKRSVEFVSVPQHT